MKEYNSISLNGLTSQAILDFEDLFMCVVESSSPLCNFDVVVATSRKASSCLRKRDEESLSKIYYDEWMENCSYPVKYSNKEISEKLVASLGDSCYEQENELNRYIIEKVLEFENRDFESYFCTGDAYGDPEHFGVEYFLVGETWMYVHIHE